MLADVLALALIVIGVILSSIGCNASRDLKGNKFIAVWKADGGLNQELVLGSIFLVLGVATHLLL
jgi:hypothetical protein